MTQLATASHRCLLPSPSFAFDGVRTPPEELVNFASPKLALRFVRSRVNQPDPTFPQSPGIILKRTTSILLSAARFVLSMNCKHHITVLDFAYDLIFTVYPPKTHCEKRVNNSDSPLKLCLTTISASELFTAEIISKKRGEQVAFGICPNISTRQAIFPGAKSVAVFRDLCLCKLVHFFFYFRRQPC